MNLMVDEAGNIWEVDASGNPVRIVGSANQPAPQAGPQPFTMGQRDPNKAVQNDIETQIMQERLNQMRNPENEPNSDLKTALLQAQVAKAQADAQKAKEGTAGSAAGNLKTDQRAANLEALQNQINTVRGLYEQNFKGGVPNAIVGMLPDMIRPQNGQFDAAGAGMGEVGLAAFRVPGVGSQSDQEQRNFILANTPQSGDSDLVIEQKLQNLQNRLDATRGQMGEQPQAPTFGQPNAVNPNNPLGGVRANGVHRLADTTQSQIVGRSEGGWFADPALADVGPIVKRMLQNNRSAAEINAYVDGRYQASGAVKMNAEQRAQIAGLVAARRRNPTIPAGQLATDWGNFGMVQRNANPNGPTLGEQFAKSPAGAFSISAGNAASAGLLDEMAGVVGGEGAQQRMQAVKDQSRAENWKSAMAGDIAGGTLAMVGLNRAIGAAGQGGAKLAGMGGGIAPDIAYGAAYGAGESNDNRALGAVTGAASAAAGNVVGRGVTGMFGRGIAPSGGKVPELYNSGVKPTIGQRFAGTGWVGNAVNNAEQALQSVPLLGLMVNGARQEARDQFETGAFNKALTEIGGSLPQGVQHGPDAINFTRGAFNDAYEQARAGMQMIPDSQFATDQGAWQQQFLHSGRLTDDAAARAQKLIGNHVGARQVDGAWTGDNYKRAISDLNEVIPTIADPELAGAMKAYRGIFDDAARRSSDPQAVAMMDQADRGYAMYKRVTEAAKMAGPQEAGRFTPQQLKRADIKAVGKSDAYIRGDSLMGDYVNQGMNLVDTLPNSGTADRLLATQGAGLGVLGPATYMTGPTIPVAALATTAPYAPVARKVMQKALSPRAQGGKADRLGNAIKRNARRGGMFGAGFSAPLAISFGIGSE